MVQYNEQGTRLLNSILGGLPSHYHFMADFLNNLNISKCISHFVCQRHMMISSLIASFQNPILESEKWRHVLLLLCFFFDTCICQRDTSSNTSLKIKQKVIWNFALKDDKMRELSLGFSGMWQQSSLLRLDSDL